MHRLRLIMQKPFLWLLVDSPASHIFNHKVAVFYLSKSLLPLQRCHLTYISKLTGRNKGDKKFKWVWPYKSCLLIHFSARWKKWISLVDSSMTCHRGWHAQLCHQSSINIRTVGGGDACWAARKQMVFASMTDARLLPRIPAQTKIDTQK